MCERPHILPRIFGSIKRENNLNHINTPQNNRISSNTSRPTFCKNSFYKVSVAMFHFDHKNNGFLALERGLSFYQINRTRGLSTREHRYRWCSPNPTDKDPHGEDQVYVLVPKHSLQHTEHGACAGRVQPQMVAVGAES